MLLIDKAKTSQVFPSSSTKIQQPNLSPYSLSDCKEVRVNNEPPSHRHHTRSKQQHTNATLQLEQKQMKEYLPFTFNFSDVNATNLPNQLKHNKLIQGPEKR